MNKFSTIAKAAAVSATALLAAVFATTGVAQATIPYDGPNTPNSPVPAFNQYTGTPVSGDEPDFLRGKVDGDTGDSKNDVSSTCETGKRFRLRVYVHNNASVAGNQDGNGPSVAHNTKVKVNGVEGAQGSSFVPSATISASNAASVSDTMNITCSDGKQVSMKYVRGSAQQYSGTTGTVGISDDIVLGNGAAIGSKAVDGKMYGCWDERVWVTLVVEVKEVPKEVPSSAICIVDDKFFKVVGRTVTITVDAQLQNATKTGKYEINWGDGSAVSTKQSDSHTYTADGSYTINARVEVKLADGTVKWVSGGSCTQQVTFKQGNPTCPIPGKEHLPVDSPECKKVTTVTPPANGKLSDTGPGDTAGLFAGVSGLGAAVHNFVTRRRRK